MNYQWIKIRHKLLRSPKLYIAMRELGLTKAEVIGFFVMALAVFDEHSEDGLIKNTTPDILDGMIEQPGITEVLARPDIGWIEITDEGIRILDWDKHNSFEAKKKAVLSKRRKLKQKQPQEPQLEEVSHSGIRGIHREVAKESQSKKDDARQVLNWVNEIKGGKPFTDNEVNLDFIIGRLKQKGVTMEGVRKMLEYKWRDVAGTEFEKYFRPATLFNKTKFATYYDEKDFEQAKNNSTPEYEEYRCQPDGTGVENCEGYVSKKAVDGSLREDLEPGTLRYKVFEQFLAKFHIDEALYTARIKREREQNAASKE